MTSRCESEPTSSLSTRWPALSGCAVFTHSLLTIVLAAFSAPQAGAQPATNAALYQDIALHCLGDVPNGLDRLILEAPSTLPFVRSALVSAWQEADIEIFIDEGAEVEGPRLSYSIEEAGVDYLRADRRLARSVRLALRYSLVGDDGRVIVDDVCRDARHDYIMQDDVSTVESDAYRETQGQLPPAGWFRRVLEPAVVTAASAVAVYLFFVLRSSDGGGS